MTKPSSSRFDTQMQQMRLESELAETARDNKSRSRIAYWFAGTFVLISAIITIGGPLYNAMIGQPAPVDINEVLANFMSHFGTPLGFVLGYYFKEKLST